jgi:ketosteroid isomerase-like protein
MMKRLMLAPLAAALLVTASPAATPAEDKAAIVRVIADMQQAWNRGDFRGYMSGFANPQVVFVSGGRIQDGWQGTLDHYIRDYGGDPARRGTVRFYDMSVELLAPDAALLISHYHLERAERPQEGINTRLFRKIGGHWLITMNHVSSYESHDPPAR